MDVKRLTDELLANSYPGRGIVAGRSADGTKAVLAYWIMGRSDNSRNRVFTADGDGIRTQAADSAKMIDPSLVIYYPVRVVGGCTVVTNGDQTDTIAKALKQGGTFKAALATREAEPDAPHYTPRISALACTKGGELSLSLSVIKTDCGSPSSTCRYYFDYESPRAGVGRYSHTYTKDAQVLESFAGEPVLVGIEGDIDEFAASVWRSLSEENKVSLFVRFIDIQTGEWQTRIFNKYQRVSPIS